MYIPINGWTKVKILEHIKKEFKGKSMFEDGERCAYRGPQSRKCAIGMFIPENLYNVDMEGKSAISVFKFPEIEKVVPLHVKALLQLQIVHDESKPDKTLENMIDWVETNVK